VSNVNINNNEAYQKAHEFWAQADPPTRAALMQIAFPNGEFGRFIPTEKDTDFDQTIITPRFNCVTKRQP